MNDLLAFLKLNLLHAGYAKLDSSWNFKNVVSPFVRLFLITEGEAKASYANQSFILKKGCMYLIPSFTRNDYNCDGYHEQFYTGFFEEIKLGLSVFNLKNFKYEVRATQEDYMLFKRLLAINPKKNVLDNNPKAHVNAMLPSYKAHKFSSPTSNIETQGILTILLSRFLESIQLNNAASKMKPNFDGILEYIAIHLGEELSVSQLATYCNLSPDHFSRLFQNKYELKPIKYIQLKRIERAQFLLLTTKDSLAQIAQTVGLGNISYFSRKFKEHAGFGPAAFRKKQLKG